MLDVINNRSHRRVLVVDGHLGFTRGAGSGETLLGDRFYPKLEAAGPARAQVIPSTRRASSSATKLLSAVSIAAATRRIWLANSYFVPDGDTIRLFSDAARRGVDVRILVAVQG